MTSKRYHINKEELYDMMVKYNIGKKPLSKLLGWGETTVHLHCAMENIPVNDYSERLYQLYLDKTRYLDILIKNRSNITNVAFRKSILAIHKPILDNRILFTAQYIFDNSKKYLSLSHLEVIVMWSQILAMRFLDKPLFDDIYQPTKGNGNSPYKVLADGYRDKVFFCFPEYQTDEDMRVNLSLNSKLELSMMLKPEEKEIIDHVAEMFLWYGEKAYNSLLAAERFRLCGPSSSRTRKNVSNDMMKKIYGEALDQAKVKKLKDIDGFMAKRIEALRKKVLLTE